MGRPYMTWGHTLKKALKAFDIPTDFEERAALAKNRNEWKHRTHPQKNDPHTQRELSLTHKANSEEQPQTQKPAANRPAEVPSWANPHEHGTRRDAPGRS